MSLITVTDNCVKYFDTKYFVDNAPLQTLGGYGEKAGGIIETGKLEPKDHLPIANLKGKTTTLGPITLDSSNSSKSDFNKAVAASLKVVGFSGSVDATYSALVSKELQLVQLWIEPNDVKRWINASPKALDNLRNYGGDARVVHTLFVVTTAVFASSFTGGVSYDLNVNAAGIVTVTTKGGTSVAGKDVITLSTGMCLAYGMLKLDWGKGKDFVEDLNVDEVGMK